MRWNIEVDDLASVMQQDFDDSIRFDDDQRFPPTSPDKEIELLPLQLNASKIRQGGVFTMDSCARFWLEITA
jgi:hypothetical protein